MIQYIILRTKNLCLKIMGFKYIYIIFKMVINNTPSDNSDYYELKSMSDIIQKNRNQLLTISREQYKRIHGIYWYIYELDTYVPIDKTTIIEPYYKLWLGDNGDFSVIRLDNSISLPSVDEFHKKYCRYRYFKRKWIYNANNSI